MEECKINLAILRENTGWGGTGQTGMVRVMTQKVLATRLGIEQSQVSRFEKNPDTIPLKLLLKWLQMLGVRWEDAYLMMYEGESHEPKGVDPGLPWSKLHRNCDLLLEYISTANSIVMDFRTGNFTVETLGNLAREMKRKPNIVFAGKFDSGKSRLANGLTGNRYLPDRYRPATRLITYVCHLKDRPSWLREEVIIIHQNVFQKMGKHFNPMNISGMDSNQIEVFNRECKIVGGNLEILKDYALYYGKHSSEKNAKYAVVYMDSHILEACNIIDLPGYGASEHDDVERAEESARAADILVYTSSSVGFLDAEDFARMHYAVSGLPRFEDSYGEVAPVGNLFIVATHASPDKQYPEDFFGEDGMCDIAAERLYRIISSTWSDLSEKYDAKIDAKILLSRMFTYWAEILERRENLEIEMQNLLDSALPEERQARADRTIAEYKGRAEAELSAQVHQYQSLIDNLSLAKAQYAELIKKEPSRKAWVINKRDNIIKAIEAYRTEHMNELEHAYSDIMTLKRLEKIISHYESKDEAQRYLGIHILDKMQGHLGKFGATKAAGVEELIKIFLEVYEISLSKTSTDVENPILPIPFDARGMFLDGLTGLTAIGALAWWISNLGNLESYIFAAKLTKWLSAMGINVGGGTAIISFFAAIGGPLSVGATIGLAVGAVNWGITGASWQKKLAKKTIEAFRTKEIMENLRGGINKFWDTTMEAFNKGADNVESEYLNKLTQLESDLNSGNSREELEAKLSEYTEVREFLTNAPWVPLSR